MRSRSPIRASPSSEQQYLPTSRRFERVSRTPDGDSDDSAWYAPRKEGFVADDEEQFKEDLVLVGDQLRPRPLREHAGLPEPLLWDGHDGYYDNNHVFYSFTGPASDGHRGSSHGGGLDLSDNESSMAAAGEEHEVPEPDATALERGVPAYHILESQYAGDGYEEGHHFVKLTAVLSERATVPQSLFRWMYGFRR